MAEQKHFSGRIFSKEQTERFTTYATKQYNALAKQLLQSKEPAEPWLHVQVLTDIDKTTRIETIYYAIYVWDTRKLVEDGFIELTDQFSSNEFMDAFTNISAIPNVLDEHEPIIGDSSIVEEINNRWSKETK